MARGHFCLLAEGTRGHGLDKPRESRLSVATRVSSALWETAGHKGWKGSCGAILLVLLPRHPAGLSRVTAG